MKKAEQIKYWEDLGKQWLTGEMKIEGWNFGERKVNLNSKQVEFVNNKTRYCLYGGAYASGKTLPLLLKTFLLCLFFPKNRILLGRKTLKELDQVTLPDLFEIVPAGWYEYRKGDGILEFFNGSQIILFGLDALQSGSDAEIKKAQQAIKSLNLGGFVIDQLEEVTQDVFVSLTGRMRRDIAFQQGNATTNPENYWAYDYFKANPRPNTFLIEGSMIDNKENLSKEFLEDQMSQPDSYKRRYVYGEWNPNAFTKGQVFAPEYMDTQELFLQEPIYEYEGAKVFEEYNEEHSYFMSIDPSEGAVDPCAITIVDGTTGNFVLTYSDFVPANVIAEKAIIFASRYGEPLMIPEKNGNGAAVLEILKQNYNNIYYSQVFDKREQRNVEKLGFSTNVRTKRLLIANFTELLRRGMIKIKDREYVKEMRTFVWTDDVRKQGAGAQENYHDDRIMSAMLACVEMNPQIQHHSLTTIRKQEDNIIKAQPAIYR